MSYSKQYLQMLQSMELAWNYRKESNGDTEPFPYNLKPSELYVQVYGIPVPDSFKHIIRDADLEWANPEKQKYNKFKRKSNTIPKAHSLYQVTIYSNYGSYKNTIEAASEAHALNSAVTLMSETTGETAALIRWKINNNRYEYTIARL